MRWALENLADRRKFAAAFLPRFQRKFIRCSPLERFGLRNFHLGYFPARSVKIIFYRTKKKKKRAILISNFEPEIFIAD